MNDLALRPRSPTELVDAALQVFRRDPIQFIVATTAVYVPWLVLRLLLDLGISTDLPSPQQAAIAAVAAVIVYALVGGVITVIASDVYLGAPADAARALRVALTRVVPLLVTGVVTVIFIALGAILFILPAFYVLARFFAVRQVVVLEEAGSLAALGRSSQLSLGEKRHVLNTLLLVLLITSAISLGVGLLSGLIPSRVLFNVVLTAVHIVLYPFFGITETLLYYDIRIRKEGFDVEYLAATTPTVAAGQPGEPR
jgi:hypothetical protein